MIKISWDQNFKRTYKKGVKQDPELKERFWAAVDVFSQNPTDARLRSHRLTGKLERLWAFSVSQDCQVILRFIDKGHVLFIDIAGHDEAY